MEGRKIILGVIEYEKFNPFYVFLKRHYCPKCQRRLITSYTNKIIPRKEVDQSKFNFGDVTFTGDLEIRCLFFWCPNCDYKISLRDMKEYEKSHR